MLLIQHRHILQNLREMYKIALSIL
jgi:hypothetical protein